MSTVTRSLILVGFKSAGKSTLGKILSERLGSSFLDTDRLIEEIYFKKEGVFLSFRDIFKEVCEERFREIELEAIIQSFAGSSKIISLGGGSLELIVKNGIDISNFDIVFVNVEKSVLLARILKRGIPSFIDAARVEDSFDELYSLRLSNYLKYSDFVVDNSSNDPNLAADEILRYLKQKSRQ